MRPLQGHVSTNKLPVQRLNTDRKKSKQRAKSKQESSVRKNESHRSLVPDADYSSHLRPKKFVAPPLESSAVEQIPDFGPQFQEMQFSTPSAFQEEVEDLEKKLEFKRRALSRASSTSIEQTPRRSTSTIKPAFHSSPRIRQKYWDLISKSIINSLAPKYKCVQELILQRKKLELEKKRSMKAQKSMKRKFSRRVGIFQPKIRRESSVESPIIKTPLNRRSGTQNSSFSECAKSVVMNNSPDDSEGRFKFSTEDRRQAVGFQQVSQFRRSQKQCSPFLNTKKQSGEGFLKYATDTTDFTYLEAAIKMIQKDRAQTKSKVVLEVKKGLQKLEKEAKISHRTFRRILRDFDDFKTSEKQPLLTKRRKMQTHSSGFKFLPLALSARQTHYPLQQVQVPPRSISPSIDISRHKRLTALMQTNKVDLESVGKQQRKIPLLVKLPQTQHQVSVTSQVKKLPKIYSEALYNRLADVRERSSPGNLRDTEKKKQEKKVLDRGQFEKARENGSPFIRKMKIQGEQGQARKREKIQRQEHRKEQTPSQREVSEFHGMKEEGKEEVSSKTQTRGNSQYNQSSTTASRGSTQTPFCSAFRFWSAENEKISEEGSRIKIRFQKETSAQFLKRVYARRAK